MRYLDSDTLDQCHHALRDGRTLDELAVRLHLDTEYLGRLLQLPTTTTTGNMVDEQPADYLWSCDRLDGVL